jgi:serine/threonine protein phosphatase PrpC
MSWAGSEYSEEYYPPEALEKQRVTYVQPKVGPFDLIKVKKKNAKGDDFESESKFDRSDDDLSNEETDEATDKRFLFTPAAVLKRAKFLNEIGLERELRETVMLIPNFVGKTGLCGIFEAIGDGGVEIAEWASTKLPSELKTRWKKIQKGKMTCAEALREAFLATHKSILLESKLAEDEGSSKKGSGWSIGGKKKAKKKVPRFESRKSGSTATIAWLFPTKIVCANVGRGGVVVGELQNSKNSLKLAKILAHAMSENHSTVSSTKERKRVLKCGAALTEHGTTFGGGTARLCEPDTTDPGLLVTRALGCSDASHLGLSPEPSIKELELSFETKICIIGSSGFWDSIGPFQAVKDIIDGIDAEGAVIEDPASFLLSKAYVRRTCRNISIISIPIVDKKLSLQIQKMKLQKVKLAKQTLKKLKR